MPSWKPNCLKAAHQSFNIGSQSSSKLHHDNSLNSNNDSHYNTHSHEEAISFEYTNALKHQAKHGSSKNLHKVSVPKGFASVELHRANGSQFGLTISDFYKGGCDKDSKARICDLKPGSVAQKSDELQVGDIILSINGVKTQGLKHEEIIEMIKNADDTLRLEIEYNLPPWPIHPPNTVRSQTVHIQLEKEVSSYGFTIRGGSNDDKTKSRPLIVTNIRAASPADREGTLKIGDRIIAINGINVLNASLQDAYAILKQCKGVALFLIEYDSAIVDSIKNSNGPLLIEIEKSPGSSIGIKLNMVKAVNGKNQILVENVKPASIADRCGAIFVGDQILSIDDTSFESLSLADANQILKNCVGEFLRVEILPLSQINPSRPSSCKSSLNSCGASLSANQVSHAEVAEVALKSDDNGTFGFTLQGGQMMMHNNHMMDNGSSVAFPVIGYVEPNSAAERSNLMQPGDRIVAINGRSLDGLTIDDARQMIKDSGSQLSMEIEFDVADNIMLTSGVFQVKLVRKNLDLGVSVVYPKFLKNDDYPLISDVKRGSVAYRSGMLQPGDRLMFIDHISLRGKPISEVIQLLKNTDEIVKLKIKKDEIYTAEDNADEKVVVYTVEMQRNGGPLGITISGSDEPFDPIYVSGLTEGGLAERTNAIHVGDIILAINSVSLRGKTLTEAIDLLRYTEDVVTLKISRNISDSASNSAKRQPKSNLGVSSLNGNSNGSLNKPHNNNSNHNNNHNNNNHNNYSNNSNNNQNSNNHNSNNHNNQNNHNSSNFIHETSPKQQPMSNGGTMNRRNEAVHNSIEQKPVLNFYPFPLDMTSFMQNSNENSFMTNGDKMRKNGSSLDSINAVERELDEVLRDLEMNSNELNIAIEESDSDAIELPITVQKSSNQPLKTPSYTNNLNKHNSIPNCNRVNLNSSSFINNAPKNQSPDFLSSNNNRGGTSSAKDIYEAANNGNGHANGNRRRQNVLSTYEYCQDCYDSDGAVSNHKHTAVPSMNNANSDCKIKFPKKNEFAPLTEGLPYPIHSHNHNHHNQNGNSSNIKITLSSSAVDAAKTPNGVINSNSTTSINSTASKQANGVINGKPPLAVRFNKNNLVNTNKMTSQSARNISTQKVINVLDRSPKSSLPRTNTSINAEDGKVKLSSSSSNNIEERVNAAGSAAAASPQIYTSSTSLNRRKPTSVSFNGSANFSSDSLFINNNNNGTKSQSESSCTLNKIVENDKELSDVQISESEFGENSGMKTKAYLNRFNSQNDIEYVDACSTEDERSCTSSNDRVEVTLDKDHRFGDFGFSISDSVNSKGIFVNKVRNSSIGPYLKPYTQIYQINNIDTSNMECSQVYKLLSNEQSNKDRMRLVISKSPKYKEKLFSDGSEFENGDEGLFNGFSSSEKNFQNLTAMSACRSTAL